MSSFHSFFSHNIEGAKLIENIQCVFCHYTRSRAGNVKVSANHFFVLPSSAADYGIIFSFPYFSIFFNVFADIRKHLQS